jgi:phospholipid-transporting ATPase
VLTYNASSPDELALTNAGRHYGITFKERDESGNMILENKFTLATESYELLHVIEFTSARKRMSVIVRFPDDRIMLLTKGADSHIEPRLRAGQQELTDTTSAYLADYAKDGLRTLILAQREVDPEFFKDWSERYTEAMASMVGRDEKMDVCSEEIEQELELVGSTAIEDKLQDEVGDVIAHMRTAGVKVWVLTGDKIETAINIGFACRLLDTEMEVFVIDKVSTADIYEQLKLFCKQAKKCARQRETAVVIGGDSLGKILRADGENKARMQGRFLELTEDAKSVLCCRVSPKQKADVVRLIMEHKPDVTTLSIGDGANDVNMIQAANIGVGIKGLEGQQAARAADYAIGQFKHLRSLMFAHGRECYRRNSYLITYFFYKNVVFTLPLFFFGARNLFSGLLIYDVWLYQSYNLFFTSMPIVWFAIYDWEFDKEHLLQAPATYEIGLKNRCFTPLVFWRNYA